RAGYRRARRLGSRKADAHPLGARPAGLLDDDPLVGRAGAVALAPRRSRLRGARMLRLVRPPPLRRGRGQRLDRPPKIISAQIATKSFRPSLDQVTAFA